MRKFIWVKISFSYFLLFNTNFSIANEVNLKCRQYFSEYSIVNNRTLQNSVVKKLLSNKIIEYYKALNKSSQRSLNSIDISNFENQIINLTNNLDEIQSIETLRYFEEDLKLPIRNSNEGALNIRSSVSRNNLNRVLSNMGDSPKSYLFKVIKKDIEERLTEFFTYFTHNGNSISGENQLFWLSSEQLKNLGFNGGLQSKLNFNSDFLNTKNWIFFWVTNSTDPRYGGDSLYLNFEYANKVGFISPFVMYIYELFDFGVAIDPIVGNQLLIDLKNNFPLTWKNAKMGTPDVNSKLFKPGLEKLLTNLDYDKSADYDEVSFLKEYKHYFDYFKKLQGDFLFTPSDYIILCTEVLSRYLYTKKSSLFWLLKKPEKLFNPEWGWYLSNEIRKAFENFNLPSNFELKLPVAIPAEQIVFGKKQSR